MNGGIPRYFEEIEKSVTNNAVFQRILLFTVNLCRLINKKIGWHIEVHQFRIMASKDHDGKPTPEGIHRDGRDYVFIMMVHSDNISGGVTHLYSTDRKLIKRLELKNFSASIFLGDTKRMHKVSVIKPVSSEKAAYRDMLVITFRTK